MTTIPTSPITIDSLPDLIAVELDDLIAIRHDIHAHPEMGYNEHRTSGIVARELKNAGVDFKDGLAGGTGVLGHLPAPGSNEKAIGLRADMDALPITEETGLPYASTHPGVMHACGHDGHTTMLIGAARVLAKLSNESPLPRPVTFCFQPAEEGGAGGNRMVEDGCLRGTVIGPPVEMMFGLHCWPLLRLNAVMTRTGPMLAAADMIEIKLRGKGAHAAMPQHGHDPILAGSNLVSALQQIASRNVDPLDSIVVSITQFHGGTTHNIIPETVELMGTVRTLLPETQELAIRRINEIATHIAAAHGCEAEVDYQIGYPVTNNHADAVKIFNDTARNALGESRVDHMELPVMGGEDFSFYCNEVPSCFFALGMIPEGKDTMVQVHHPKFNFNDDAIATGVEMFCRLALRTS